MRDVVAHEFDVPDVRHAQTPLVGHPQKRNTHRVEAHEPRSHGIDGHGIRRSQHQILDPGHHRARPRAVPRDGAVHDREDGWMQFALHVQEIDEHLVHVLVRVVPDFTQQPAKGVLHRARHHRMPVSLHGRQVQDLPSGIDRGNLNPIREDRIQLQQRALEAIDLPGDVGQCGESEPVPLEHRPPAIVPAPLMRIRDDRAILDGNQTRGVEAVGEELGDDAVQLPGLRGARREILGPGQIQLDEGVGVPREGVPVPGQIHDPGVVLDDGRGPCPQDRNAAGAIGAAGATGATGAGVSMMAFLSVRAACTGGPRP